MAGPFRNCAPNELLANKGARPATVVTVVSRMGRKRLGRRLDQGIHKTLPFLQQLVKNGHEDEAVVGKYPDEGG